MAAPRDFGEQPAGHPLALLRHLLVEGALELVAAGLQSARLQIVVDLAGHLVQTQLHHRHERRGRDEEIEEPRPADLQLGLSQLLEALPEMDQHQIGLVAQKIDQGARPLRAPLHRGEQTGRLLGDGAPSRGVERPHAVPPDREQLVEYTPSLERLRHLGIVHRAFSRRRRAGGLR